MGLAGLTKVEPFVPIAADITSVDAVGRCDNDGRGDQDARTPDAPGNRGGHQIVWTLAVARAKNSDGRADVLRQDPLATDDVLLI
jgi:hypothetical protein